MNKKVEYIGKDLEAMAFAVNYHRWILALMKPFFGKHLVEVGAGTGAFSELLFETGPETMTLVEPSAMFETLQTNLAKHESATTIRAFQNIFAEVAAQIETEHLYDKFVVPVAQPIESSLPLPLGKNLFFVGEKL